MEETERKLEELRRKGISIEIVGAGDDFDSKYLDVDIENEYQLN